MDSSSRFKLDPDLKLSKIAQMCPFHYTGADFYALGTDAMLKAMIRKIEEVNRAKGTSCQLTDLGSFV
jgi:peroxin-6